MGRNAGKDRTTKVEAADVVKHILSMGGKRLDKGHGRKEVL